MHIHFARAVFCFCVRLWLFVFVSNGIAADVELSHALSLCLIFCLYNFSILSLPMVMNLIPISCLTQLSSTGILVFTLLSDVLTTVPFIIKGYELLSMGNRRTVREETYYTDPSKGNFLILETWAAECRMKDVKTYGWLFILLGFAVLVMGVFCEFQAARLRRRWTKDGVLVIPGKKKIFETFLGRDVSSENDDETGLPFFDPDDEAAAFKAQQQAVLVRSSGNA